MLTKQQLQDAAKQIGAEYGAVAAVVTVESGGDGMCDKFPKILFEGHIFSRLTGGKYDKTNPTISYPKWTKQFYAKTQEGERKRLDEAVALNRDAALQSASWGLFQIMGMNYKLCGFNSVQEFVNKNCASEEEQLAIFLTFLKNSGILQFLIAKDWVNFAKRYNGPGYAANKYDVKLQQAYNKFKFD